jgi:hypothetical protein
MRYLVGFVFVLALGVMGCSETSGEGGSGGDGGSGGTAGDGGSGGAVSCMDSVCPCTEGGIRAAIAEGGGPFTFDCDGPQTVMTETVFIIDNDVILDGEGNLTVDGHGVASFLFFVGNGVTAHLRGLTVSGASGVCGIDFTCPGGIENQGTLTLMNCTVSENSTEAGVANGGTMTVTDTTVSANGTVSANTGTGIFSRGTLTVTNSTVSGNIKDGIVNGDGTATLTNCTVSGNGVSAAEDFGIVNSADMTLTNCTVSGHGTEDEGIVNYDRATLAMKNSLVDGDCRGDITSLGYNIESPGDTCGFDQEGDQANVTEGQLNLGPLADNGGPTMTHALGAGSVAIDKIPADMCEVDEDQRGFPRDSMCDVGAFEVQP